MRAHTKTPSNTAYRSLGTFLLFVLATNIIGRTLVNEQLDFIARQTGCEDEATHKCSAQCSPDPLRHCPTSLVMIVHTLLCSDHALIQVDGTCTLYNHTIEQLLALSVEWIALAYSHEHRVTGDKTTGIRDSIRHHCFDVALTQLIQCDGSRIRTCCHDAVKLVLAERVQIRLVSRYTLRDCGSSVVVDTSALALNHDRLQFMMSTADMVGRTWQQASSGIVRSRRYLSRGGDRRRTPYSPLAPIRMAMDTAWTTGTEAKEIGMAGCQCHRRSSNSRCHSHGCTAHDLRP